MPLNPATRKKILKAVRLVQRDGLSIRKACGKAGIGKSTFYKYREQLEEDSTLQTIKKGAEKEVEVEGEEILDTVRERRTDLKILNHLLSRLIEGVEKDAWTFDEVEKRMLKLIDAKGRLLMGADKARQWVQSLTLVDARTIRLEDVPEDIRRQLFKEITEEIWDLLSPQSKEALRLGGG